MKWLPLVWAGIWRKKGRSILTLVAIVNAFLMFGLLQGLSTGIDNITRDSNAAVLMAFSKISQIEPLPMGLGEQIKTVPGVAAVSPMVIFTGTLKTNVQYVPAVAVDVDQFLTVNRRLKTSAGGLEAMRQTRNGALANPQLMKNYGWKVGDTVPINSLLWVNRDGSRIWPVKIVGTISGGPPMLVNYSFVDEGRNQSNGTTSFFLIRIADPTKAAQVGAAVDALFANSPNETKTITQRQMASEQLKQVGDIGLVITAIVGAIFFALLFTVGAVMAQSMRERIPELAVLKTLGMTDAGVLTLLLTETLIFCLFSAGIGLGLAQIAFPLVRKTIGLEIDAGLILSLGFMLAAGLAVICGLPPAIRAMRLRIVDALAGR
jgi:putative ABC transport system permease protein